MVTLSKIIEGLEMVDDINDCYYNPNKDEIFLSNIGEYEEEECKLKLILASSSKPRQDIFKNIGLKYEVIKSKQYSDKYIVILKKI